ncbi:MAG: DUF2125 domain-containing protein [Xanthobacteraceae bacterium]
MSEPTAAARRPWRVFLPFALMIVVALAWSAAWYFAARRADATITAWIEQEARFGRIYSCGSRSSGGYPFRIEMRCADPAVELAAVEPPRVLRAKELMGVAQIYQPDLIIAEITGPLSIGEAGRPTLWRADWRLAQTSLRGVVGSSQRVSIVLEAVRFERTDGTTTETWAAANRVEAHLRRGPASASDRPVLDLAAQVAGATVPSAAALGGRPFDAELVAVLRGLTDLRPKPMPARLKEWQAAGGRLQVAKFRLQQGEAVAVAAGDIGLSAAGRPDGAFDITMAGFDRLAQDLLGRAQGGALQFGLMAGLAWLGRPAEIDGKRAVAVPLRVNDGAVYLGRIPLGKVEPLF